MTLGDDMLRDEDDPLGEDDDPWADPVWDTCHSPDDRVTVNCIDCGAEMSVPANVPSERYCCSKCLARWTAREGRGISTSTDMSTGTTIAWVVAYLLVGAAASASWFYLHQLMHWMEGTSI